MLCWLSKKIVRGSEISLRNLLFYLLLYHFLNGHSINRGLTSATHDGEVISVEDGRTLTIMDSSADKTGVITGGYSSNGGGGIHINSGVLILESGTISGNKTIDRGGGIKLNDSNSRFIMNGGVISDNIADGKEGGGVAVWKGIATLNAGTITKNTAKMGGGVHLEEYRASEGSLLSSIGCWSS